jgi:hypothetical protein
MITLPSIQDEIENIASQKLTKDINALSERFRNLLDDMHIGDGVQIRLLSDDDKKSVPYLSQLFISEEVRLAIRRKYLPEYIKREIKNLLNAKI